MDENDSMKINDSMKMIKCACVYVERHQHCMHVAPCPLNSQAIASCCSSSKKGHR